MAKERVRVRPPFVSPLSSILVCVNQTGCCGSACRADAGRRIADLARDFAAGSGDGDQGERQHHHADRLHVKSPQIEKQISPRSRPPRRRRRRRGRRLPRRGNRRGGVRVDFTLGFATDDGGSNDGHQGQHDERLHSRVSFALRAVKMVGLATDDCKLRACQKSCQLPIFAPT